MLILASKSPRRKELLSTLTTSFEIVVSNINEDLYKCNSPQETVLNIAFKKGEDIFQNHNNDAIISADTIVVIDNQIIGKPKDENDAIRILNLLSGHTHYVYTAYVIFHKDKVIKRLVESEVIFNKLDANLINEYVKTGSPLDKAGAYGVQDNDKFPIVEKVNGSLTNVIGFPIEEIKKDLIELGLI
jgi:septum formation protein